MALPLLWGCRPDYILIRSPADCQERFEDAIAYVDADNDGQGCGGLDGGDDDGSDERCFCCDVADPSKDPSVDPDDPNLCSNKDPDGAGDGDPAQSNGDCDDEDPTRNSEAPEVCNGLDDDCDGATDDADTDYEITDETEGATAYYPDCDADAFGDSDGEVWACLRPAGIPESDGCEAVAVGGDCDDADEFVNPDAIEVCNGVDDNCDSSIDEGFDTNGDGTADCDAIEECDGIDNNGDGAIDEGFDSDSDGTADCFDVEECDGIDNNGDGAADEGFDTDGDGTPDCYDREVCDGLDNDGDGLTDEAGAAGEVTWYADTDADDFGDPEVALTSCDPPPGYVADDTDCDDTDEWVNPDVSEVCNNGVDDDCDGTSNSCAPTDVDLSDADARFWGESEGDYAGYSIAGAGDVDADGYDDIVVGAPGSRDGGGGGSGAAYLVLGDATPSNLVLTDATVEYDGSGTENAGVAVASAGDVNRDGFADILVGARDNDDWASTGGAVYLIFGGALPVGVALSDSSVVPFFGDVAGENLGESVAGAGDVDGDGYADILFGAREDDAGGGDAGASFLQYGESAPGTETLSSVDVKFIGESAGDYAGYSVSSAGDINGDGLADIVIGAYNESSAYTSGGRAYVVLGDSSRWASGDLSTADYWFAGEADGDRAGCAVAAAGDVDDDGFDDFLVGAYSNSEEGRDAGAVYLLLGATTLSSSGLADADAEYRGIAPGDEAGRALASASDFNGDSYDDFVIGAPGADDGGDGAGTAYLILGAASLAGGSLAGADAVFVGESAGDNAGGTLGWAGDVNADGQGDFVAGSWHNDAGGESRGTGYLLLGVGF